MKGFRFFIALMSVILLFTVSEAKSFESDVGPPGIEVDADYLLADNDFAIVVSSIPTYYFERGAIVLGPGDISEPFKYYLNDNGIYIRIIYKFAKLNTYSLFLSRATYV